MTLDDLEALARAATPGPWTGPRVTDQWPPGWLGVYACDDEDGQPYEVIGTTGHALADLTVEQDQANARFIAAANPATILALVDRVRRLERVARSAELLLAVGNWSLTGPGQYTAAPRLDDLRDALSALDGGNVDGG